ncbi:cell envelope-related function transcriptional attenuator common domain-containing protein [Sinosporangium album]|uniref:Cell envelope-related function transcriptional attenuator common domain-containing protein n=1 Tax=Sinosporangium album TaxID=504805 RepID=A0A1G8FFL3_9ACTN|nr:LCP family protein [Sinosporangium album]SDH80799.1 cell envelope-related function transcriptional attenuator common domain-containing protein [Sinosporangium album]
MRDDSTGHGLAASLALTLGSALLWGFAHVWTGRTKVGLTLMALFLTLNVAALTVITLFRTELLTLIVQPRWLIVLMAVLIALALGWIAVIVRSYQLVRPPVHRRFARGAAAAVAGLVCLAITVPLAYAAHLAHVSRDLVTTLFTAAPAGPVGEGGGDGDPWKGTSRLNLLLIGADAAPNRYGVRTDSITLASIDIESGHTVLFGLPRNLQSVPMPAGPARQWFPFGFTGDGPQTPGLLNEIYQFAEDHPEVVPGVANGRRGTTLLKSTVGDMLGLDVDHYAMIDMKGFSKVIDAMGGVTVTVKEPITYGRYNEGLIPAGTRKLSGAQALWYGRSRTYGDDYVRMGRQKCLINAVVKQAEPLTVLRSFDRLAGAAKGAISTDLPQELLPGLVDLAHRVKETKIKSLQFVPPLINTADPDYNLIKDKVAAALATRSAPKSPGVSPSPHEPVSLDAACR